MRAGLQILLTIAVALLAGCTAGPEVRLAGSMKQWEPLTLELRGPQAEEAGPVNPFLDYRLSVVFSQEDLQMEVPGYFAADGEAAHTGAQRGNVWRAHFLPPRPGSWQYRISFRSGQRIAIREEEAGDPVPGDGATRSFQVEANPEARGLLQYAGGRYLRYAGDGSYFLKGGADSPENFLAYHEFDGTRSLRPAGNARPGEAALAPLHRFEPHMGDWHPEDPTWGEGRGKGIVGALNYLASRGMNSVYFLTLNVAGDGQDVWPWTGPEERYRFDCSKLDQWEIVFRHMDSLGILLHVVLTETENESLFEVEEGGEFAGSRKLYYRELVARFGHHRALVWNLGEENGWDDRHRETTTEAGRANTDAQRKAFAAYLRRLDPYAHPIVVHTLPGRYEEIYQPLLGDSNFEGASLQMGDMSQTHAETLRWLERSRGAGRPWFVCLDEIGPADTGVKPDTEDPDHDAVRRHALWGNLMAGGGGVEWYFGYRYAHNDLNLEDWRSRERMWDQTRHALEFFHNYLPFPHMEPADQLVSHPDAWCLAQPGRVYALYLGSGGTTRLQLEPGVYDVRWYDPREGGPLQRGSIQQLEGGGERSVGEPPHSPSRDWTVLLTARR